MRKATWLAVGKRKFLLNAKPNPFESDNEMNSWMRLWQTVIGKFQGGTRWGIT